MNLHLSPYLHIPLLKWVHNCGNEEDVGVPFCLDELVAKRMEGEDELLFIVLVELRDSFNVDSSRRSILRAVSKDGRGSL